MHGMHACAHLSEKFLDTARACKHTHTNAHTHMDTASIRINKVIFESISMLPMIEEATVHKYTHTHIMCT